jgi:thioredoxin-like negative regulator of GroEL
MFSLLIGVGWRCYLIEPETELFDQSQKDIGRGQLERAEYTLRRVIARDPMRTDARLLLAKLAHTRQKPHTVAAVFREIPDSDPLAGAIRVAEGDAWLSLDLARNAEDCWTRAYRIAPDDPQPRRRLIYLYGFQLRRALWANLLWELYDRGQAGLPEMVQLMIAEYVVWAPEDSRDRVQAFAIADPRDTHSRRALAEYKLLDGKIQQALQLLDANLQIDPNDVPSRLLAIECHLADADTVKARQAIDQLPAAAHSYAQAQKQRGSLALLEQQFDIAILECRNALRQAPFDRELRYKLAQAERMAGRFDDANRNAQVADQLATVHRLCHTLHTQQRPDLSDVRQVIQLCEGLGLIEEASGWARVGLAEDATDSYLLAARERLASLPGTSSRNPPHLVQSSELDQRSDP